MKRWFWLLCILTVIGCSHLQPDPVPSAISSEYPTLEFHLKDKVYHGLGVISVVEGSDYAALGLKVQSYYTGTIKIDSRDCGLSLSREYTSFESVQIPLSGLASVNCLVTVTMNPHYDPQNSDPIEVFGFKGYFAIRVIKQNESWVGSAHKVTGDFSQILKLNVGGTGNVRAVFDGCGIKYDQSLPLDDAGFLSIDLNQLVAKSPKTTCVLEGVVISPMFQDLLVNAVVSQYDTAFTPLPIPVITVDSGGKLSLTGDSTVSVVGLDLNHKFASSASFKNFDPKVPHIVRVFTVKGRSVLCVWGKEWTCLQ